MSPDIIALTPDYVVAVKPAGMDAERDMPALLTKASGGASGASEFYCVHRLDQAASGLLVYARNRKTAAALSEMVREHQLKKSYYIIVSGKPMETEGCFEDLLFKDSKRQKAFTVKTERKGVKRAKLLYEVLETSPILNFGNTEELSLIRVQLKTGRFHQIRVQFASRGMPIAGDGKYGSRIKCGLCLFCQSLSFPEYKKVQGRTKDLSEKSPSLTFEAPLPAEFPWNRFKTILSDVSDRL